MMTTESALDSVRGKPHQFKRLEPTFVRSYLAVTAGRESDSYLIARGSDGSVKTWTRGELDRAARSCAEALTRAENGERILAVAAENGHQFLAMALACFLEGWTLCPLNPNEDARRTEAKITSLGAPCLLFASKRAKRSNSALGAARSLEDAVAGPASDRWQPKLEASRNSVEPTVLVFTSGTTGRSKIVEQLEVGLMSNADALVERHALGSSDTIGTALPLTHVNALEFSFICSLLSGARLALHEEFSLNLTLSSFKEDGLTIYSAVPGIWRVLCAHSERIDRDWLRSFRHGVSAAAPMSPQLARSIVERLPFRVLQGYGLSEAVNFSCLTPPDLTREDYISWMTAYGRPTVGTPLPGNEVRIVDDTGADVAPGAEGRLLIRGPVVMKGYRGEDPGRTFATGWLVTGDRGFYVESSSSRGRFYFVTGREKDVIKRSGQTVSLVEVDDWLSEALAGTDIEAIAIGFEHETSGEEIGLAVSAQGSANARSAIRTAIESALAAKMPRELMPRAAVLVERPVRTPSGKPKRWEFLPPFTSVSGKPLGAKLVWLEGRDDNS